MSRTQAPTPKAKATAAKRHVPSPADPLNPLAQELGKAVAAEIRHMGRRPAPRHPELAAKASAAGVEAKEMEYRITLAVTQVLGRSLSSPTAQGKALVGISAHRLRQQGRRDEIHRGQVVLQHLAGCDGTATMAGIRTDRPLHADVLARLRSVRPGSAR